MCVKHQTSDNLYRWEPLSPEFDSINILLDDASGNYVTVDSLWRIYDKMEKSLVKVDLDSIRYKQALARMHYWKMRIYRQSSREDSANKSMKRGLALMDSIKYPYDRARIEIAKSSLSTDGLIESLKGATQSCDYAINTGDSYLEGLARTNLAVYYMYLGNLDEAMLHSKKAESLFRKIGKKRLADGTIVNTASILCQIGDTLEGIKSLRNLIESESCRLDTFVMISALHVLGEVVHDVDLMKEGFSIVSNSPRFSRRKLVFAALLIQSLIADSLDGEAMKVAFDNLSLADQYVRDAKQNSNSQGVWSAEYIYDIIANYYEKNMRNDSALVYYHKAWELNNWQREALDIASVKRAEAASELNRQKMESQKEIAHQKFVWIGIIGIEVV